VTIIGANFVGTTRVTFGSIDAASFTVNPNDTITAVTPAEPKGAVRAFVTTSYEGTGFSSVRNGFKFIVEKPTVKKVSPSTGSTAGGTAVTVTGSGFAAGNGATAFKFGKAPAHSVSCSSTTTCTMLSPAARVGTVDVTATVSGKNSKKNPADRFTYN
jgi:hypothetical protein